ncbi:MAG: glycosyltransferase [Solirubrobacterales bacterium]|nr:glycosyltransferase [Solirubrobacterales bacterium]
MKVLIVAEYYPRAADSVLGIWSHRQTLAARDAGAEVRVLVLYRPLPSLAAIRCLDRGAITRPLRQPRRAALDGLEIDYVHYLSPPRPWSYGSWGAWAAPLLARALRRVRAGFPFDLVHAHYAVPAGDAVRRASPTAPLLVSVHGGDVYGPHADSTAVTSTLAHARLVLANSAGTERRCRARGARRVRVVHLGTDLPTAESRRSESTLVTVGHLVARKRHADVIRALALLKDGHADLRYVIVGDGPERERLASLTRSLDLQGRVEFRGQLAPAAALAAAQTGSLFVLPSVEEAFGVAYVEAMAGGVPAIGCQGEDGPAEIAAAGEGIVLVPPADPAALAERIASLLAHPDRLARLGRAARETVQNQFTWPRCGRETVQAYLDVLAPT